MILRAGLLEVKTLLNMLFLIRLVMELFFAIFIVLKNYNIYILKYHSRFILKGVAEAPQIFLRDSHVLPILLSYEKHCRRNR
jgi:hypothetical protein